MQRFIAGAEWNSNSVRSGLYRDPDLQTAEPRTGIEHLSIPLEGWPVGGLDACGG
jgi:hypothetical protein